MPYIVQPRVGPFHFYITDCPTLREVQEVMELLSKRQERLARNRHSASEARERQRNYRLRLQTREHLLQKDFLDLSARVYLLKKENAELRRRVGLSEG